MNRDSPDLASQSVSPQEAVAAKIEESKRLNRFYSKLLGEVFYLGADSIYFALEGPELQVCLRKQEQVLKVIQIGATWFRPMVNWLSERQSVCFDEHILGPCKLGSEREDLDFRSALHLGEQVVVLRVCSQKKLGGRHLILLSDLRILSASQAIERVGLSAVQRYTFERIVGNEHGLIVIAAPDGENIRRAAALFRSLTDVQFVGALED